MQTAPTRKGHAIRTRTLVTGRSVVVHDNQGLRKRCGCARRKWATCPHPWHFSFKWRGTHHRFPLDKYAERPITSKYEARSEADRLRAAIRQGGFPPTSATPMTPADLTFEQFGQKWVEHGRAAVSETQRTNDESKLARLGALTIDGARLGDRPIGLITEDDIETAFAQLALRAASTHNKYRQVVRGLERWGMEKGYLVRPWVRDAKVLPRKRGAKRERRLVADELDEHGKVKTPGEERRLLAHATPWLQRLILAALETGCRRGELLSLQWQDVNLSRGEIAIRAEHAKDRELRRLPVSPRLKSVLDMVRLDPAGKPHKPTAHVFGDRIGQLVKDPKKAWAACKKAAGVTDLHFHDLRHEAGSRLLEAGGPLQHVQAMLGHADAATTSIYLNTTLTHLHESMTRHPLTTGPTLHELAHEAGSERRPARNTDQHTGAKELVN